MCVCEQIGVIGLSNKPVYPRLDPCLPHTLVPATFETRLYFSNFIDSLEKQDSESHSQSVITLTSCMYVYGADSTPTRLAKY